MSKQADARLTHLKRILERHRNAASDVEPDVRAWLDGLIQGLEMALRELDS